MSRIILFLFVAAANALAQVAPPPPATGSFQLSGHVVHASSGAPLAGVRVGIRSTSRNEAARSIVTASDGSFLFANLPEGKFSIFAQKAGFPSQGLDQHDSYATAIAVGRDKESNSILFRLKPGAVITGLVRDENGDAVRNGQVFLYANDLDFGERHMHPVRAGSLNDLGEFRFAGLPKGHYYIAVDAHPWYALNQGLGRRGDDGDSEPSALDVVYPLTFAPGTANESSAAALEVNYGEEKSVEFSLSPMRSVSLTLPVTSDSTNANVRVERIIFGLRAPSSFSFSQNPSQNAVSVTGLAPGLYDMQVRSANSNGQLDGDTANGGTKLNIGQNGEVKVLAAPSGVPLTALVRFESTPALPPNLRLMLRTKERDYNFPLAPNGSIREGSTIPRGRYMVYVPNSQGYTIQAVSATGAKVLGRMLEVGEGPLQIAVLSGKSVGVATGIALRDGSPVAGVLVLLVPEDPANNVPLFRVDQSDSDGTFTLRDIVAGSYVAVAIENGWDLEWAKPGVITPYLAKGEKIMVPLNAKLDLKLKVQ
jgi:hypothetical protein